MTNIQHNPSTHVQIPMIKKLEYGFGEYVYTENSQEKN